VDRGDSRAVLIHYHIFKNAGTTVESVLAENFGEGFATLDSSDPAGILCSEDFLRFVQSHPDIRAVSSHTLPPPKPNVPGLVFLDVILIRNPIDRLISTYEFYRRSEFGIDSSLSMMAKKLDMPQFFTHLIESYPHLVNNAQVNYLNGGRKISREPDLKRAVAIIKRSSVVGTTELFDVCMVTAEHILQAHFRPLDFSYVPQNVSPGRARDLGSRLERARTVCGEHLYERLLNLNRLDFALLDIVTDETRRNFEQMSDSEELMVNFRARCSSQISKLTLQL
jgi:Sulfotransferase family